MALSSTFIEARIASIQARITAYEAAIAAFDDGTIQSYTLDTGQNRQVVSRHEIGRLQTALDALYNQYEVWSAKRDSDATANVSPAW